MEKVSITLYQYNELSEMAKENALYSTKDGYTWMDENIDSLQSFCDHFDLKLSDYSVGDSACRGNNVKVYPLNATVSELSGTELRDYLYESGLLSNGLLDGNCPFTGYCMDEDCLDEIRDFVKNPDERSFEELVQDCAEKWLLAVIADCDYQNSEEYMQEMADANGWLFKENGTLWI